VPRHAGGQGGKAAQLTKLLQECHQLGGAHQQQQQQEEEEEEATMYSALREARHVCTELTKLLQERKHKGS
jgi:hypothetical protein